MLLLGCEPSIPRVSESKTLEKSLGQACPSSKSHTLPQQKHLSSSHERHVGVVGCSVLGSNGSHISPWTQRSSTEASTYQCMLHILLSLATTAGQHTPNTQLQRSPNINRNHKKQNKKMNPAILEDPPLAQCSPLLVTHPILSLSHPPSPQVCLGVQCGNCAGAECIGSGQR